MKFFSLLYQGAIHPSDADKVLPAADFSALLSAKDILQQAKEEAEKYKKQVEKECEELKRLAEERGFKTGLESFNLHLIHFDKQLSALRLELQRQILPLALKAAKKIVADQLALQPDTIVSIVLQALAPAVQNHHFTIYVNKSDKEILEAHKTRIKEILEALQVLTIQERSDISPGGCIIETESGIINATVENQWRALEAAFDKYMQG